MRRNPMLASLFLGLGLASPAAADAVLAKARTAAPDAAPLYTFSVDYDDGDNQFVMLIYQSKPKGARVIRITPDAASLKGDAAKKADMLKKRTEGAIWCNAFAESIPADARRISETSDTATFAFTPVPRKEDGQIGAAYKYLNATATVAKADGAILAYEMSAPKPFKPVPVAKVDRFQMKVDCATAPDGRTYMDTISLNLSGSAMMQAFAQTERRKVRDLKAAPVSGFGTP